METKYLQNTNYFHMRWTWISRLLRFIMAIFVLYLVDLQELQNESSVMSFAYFFVGVLAIALVIWPTTELAVDNKYLYLIKRSVINSFNQEKRYEIGNLKGIGFYNMSKPAGVFALFVPVWDVHRIEMIFKDDSSSSEDVMINKKDLKSILLKVREIMKLN